ncbi:sialin [Anastrepha obliqua]|uniref:sialin n=1 Tax=Anastrepha obliqua TaxID=95512 RepID=UPI002408F3C4|nr:sialin [Anastrepha obliqua]
MVAVEARTVLWYLAFIGFAVNYMIRINLNITIVEMIATNTKLVHTQTPPPFPANLTQDILVNSSYLHSTNNSINASLSSNSVAVQASNQSGVLHVAKRNSYSLEKQLLNAIGIEYDSQGFDWNEYQQGLVLGSFYWAHWVTQIPGGILAKKYGTKLVFGLSNAVGCWICFIIPLAAYWNYEALIWLRILQGLVTGLSWPAMHHMTAKWIPPNERSKFVTAYLGSSVGVAAFYPIFGYVMHWTSWEWVYHMCGVIGTIWWFCWLCLVYNTPAEHPRISSSEQRYIEKSLGASVHHTNLGPTPWRRILSSRAVWMNVIAQWGGIWGLFTMMTQAPTYFRVVHHWNIRATGILSGLPHLMRMLFALAFSMLADYLLRSDKIKRTNLRKLATALCCIVNGIMVLCLAMFGYNAVAAIAFLTLALMFHGAVSSGPLASIVDMSPNYAGIVLGISGMIGVLPGFVSSYIVGIMTLGNQTFEAWKNVFLLCAGMLIGCGVLYVLFSDSTLQEWNSPKRVLVVDPKELELLHAKVTNQNEKNLRDGERSSDCKSDS